MLFFRFRTSSRKPHYSCHVSLVTSWGWQFLRFSLFWVTLSVLSSISQIFGRMSVNWDSYTVFFMVQLKLCVRGSNITELIMLESHYVKNIYYQHDFPLFMLTLITWLRCAVEFSGFSTVKLPPLLLILYALKGSCHEQHAFKEWRAEYLYKLFRIVLLSLIHSFIHSIIYWYQHGLIFTLYFGL